MLTTLLATSFAVRSALALVSVPSTLVPLTLADEHTCAAASFGIAHECMFVTVPENRALKGGREIDLHVVVLPALGSDPAPDPVFVLMGGPGQAANDKVGYFSDYLAEVRETRDFVLVDYRGSGLSNPLDFEIEPGDMTALLEETLPMELVERELARLSKLADLTQYTTDNIVDDIDDVRRALGYEKINLYGGSYGTRAALVYLRRHGQYARTAAIKSVAPLGFPIGGTAASDAQASLDRLFADCAADPQCAEAYGDLAPRLEELFSSLREKPLVLDTTNPFDGSVVAVPVTGESVVRTVRMMLYSGADRGALPGMISRGADGHFDEWASRILITAVAVSAQIYEGMLLSVLATEDLPLYDTKAMEASSRETFLGAGLLDDVQGALAAWPRGELDESFMEPVRSDVPVLLISGEVDPVTPAGPAEEATRTLPNSLHLVFQHGSHDDAPFRPCIEGILETFYRTGSVKEIDTGCVASSPPVPFFVGR